jgi:hypothetical protein
MNGHVGPGADPGPTLVPASGGKRCWYVPDAYLPAESSPAAPSHEAACLLNVGDQEARVRFTFFFEDRDPLGPVELVLGARRTWHVRLDDPGVLGGVELPRGVPYAYTVESDVPVVLQHSRLDTSAGYTLFTTIAHGE